MDLVRRSGAPSAFASFLGLALGASCAAMTACSATSGSQGGGGWGASGGDPLGGGASAASSGGGNGGSAVSGDEAAAPSAGEASAGPMPDGSVADAGSGLSISVDGSAAPTDAPADGALVPPDFTLIDTTATTLIDGVPILGFDPIAENATINLAVTGSALSIRANTLPAIVGSVAFALDATYTHTENTAPYTLCSDNGAGVVTSCASVLTVGKHTLSATPYSGAGLTGDAGAAVILDFTIEDATDAGGQ